MSSTFDLEVEIGTLSIGRYAGRAEDASGSHRRYTITNIYGKEATELSRGDLAKLAAWIVQELAKEHEE